MFMELCCCEVVIGFALYLHKFDFVPKTKSLIMLQQISIGCCFNQ